MKKVDYILTADWHLREDQPLCRTDNYFQAQEKKIDFIIALQKKHKCHILHAGDLFHKAKSSKALEIFCMNKFDGMIGYSFDTIPGNHDLPNHQLEKIQDSSIGILSAANRINLMPVPLDLLYEWNGAEIGMIHSLIHRTNPIVADGKIISKAAKKLLKDSSEFNLILSGDNHEAFVEEYQGRLLVNPGSLMRMTAGQIEHKPRVYLYSVAENCVEEVFMPIAEGIISREHINNKQESDDRFDSFIKRVNQDYELSLSFEKNLESYFKLNKTRKPVIEAVWNHVN